MTFIQISGGYMKIFSYIFLSVLIFSFSLLSADIQNRVGFEKLDKELTRGISVEAMNGTVTFQDLADNLLGEGVEISNLQYTGVNQASGLFTNAESSGFGIDEGVILSCGLATNILGPNSSSGITGSNGQPGDSDLNGLIPGFTTLDASVLEFDFVADFNSITFTYVFGSDEYLEYVNSSFNDVFGFFLDGQNVAKIPNSTDPVSINNVNHLSHTSYFVNNDIHSGPGMGYPPPVTYNTEADGFTTSLTVTAAVTPGQTHHIRLAIADAGDRILDSWVLIKAGSFTSQVAQSPMNLNISGGIFHETDEDTPIEMEATVRGLDNSDFQWVLSSPIFGSAVFVEDRLIDQTKTIRYTPNLDYTGYDTFVCAVYDNLGGSQFETITVLTVHQNDPPVNTEIPVISGNLEVGSILTCSTGIWNDDADNQHVLPGLESNITYSYRWEAKVSDMLWAYFADEVTNQLVLTENMADFMIRCEVTATDDGTGLGENNWAFCTTEPVHIEPITSGDNPEIPGASHLISASPNPFNPNTTISFDLKEDGNARIEVYNLKGQKVKTILNKQMDAGTHQVNWNGIDEEGNVCGSGIYFYALKTAKVNELKKMLMLK